MSYLTRKQRWLRVKSVHEGIPHLPLEEGGGAGAHSLALGGGLRRPRPKGGQSWEHPLAKGDRRRVPSRSSSWSIGHENSRLYHDDGSRGGERPRRAMSGVARTSSPPSLAGGIPEEASPSRKVHFDRCVHVLLVPSRADYDEETATGIWWSCGEVMAFRKRAFAFWKLHGRLNFVSDEELASGEEDAGCASPSQMLSPRSADTAWEAPRNGESVDEGSEEEEEEDELDGEVTESSGADEGCHQPAEWQGDENENDEEGERSPVHSCENGNVLLGKLSSLSVCYGDQDTCWKATGVSQCSLGAEYPPRIADPAEAPLQHTVRERVI